jgi:hypothetical protein
MPLPLGRFDDPGLFIDTNDGVGMPLISIFPAYDLLIKTGL